MYMSTGLAAAPPMVPQLRNGRAVRPIFVPRPAPYPVRRAAGPPRPRLFIVRKPGRGLGASYNQTYGILAQDVLANVNNPGAPLTADQFKANVTADVMGVCSQLSAWNSVNGGDQACPPDIAQQIEAAAASYQAWLNGSPYVPPPSFASSNFSNYTFANAPGYQTNPYSGAVEPIPGTQVYTAQSPITGPLPPVSAPVGTMPAPTGLPLSVQIANVSRPGYAFQIGDSFSVVVTGPANKLVEVTGTHNGQSLGRTPYGNTDGSGRLTITGTLDPTTAGSWSEQWLVDGTSAGSLAFNVATPYVAPPASSGAGAGSGSSAGSGAGSGGAGGAAPAPASNVLNDFLAAKFTVAGYDVPVWAAGAGVLGALFLFGGRR